MRTWALCTAIAMLAASCGPPPAGTAGPSGNASVVPTVPGPTDSPPAQAPSPSATNASTIGRHWEVPETLRTHASISAGAFDGDRFVLVGTCIGSLCDGPTGEPAAWWSTDGRTWSSASVERMSDADMTEVAWNGAFYAAGWRYERVGDGRVPIWRSADGTSWERIGSLDRGDCRSGCYRLGPLAATSSGALVLGWIDTRNPSTSGTYWSADGADWTLVDLPSFVKNDESLPAVDVVAGRMGLVLVGACATCPATSWTSVDGSTWRKGTELGAVRPNRIDVVPYPDGLLAALGVCDANSCIHDVWRSGDGLAWERVAEVPHLGPMAFGGGRFVAVASFGDYTEVRTSADGVDWELVANDLYADDDCGMQWAIGGRDVVIVGDADCFAWYSADD